MDKVTPIQDNLLLDYLDGKLEGTILANFKSQLENSPAMKQRLDELRPVHRYLAVSKFESPSAGFVEKVMRHLSATKPAPGLSSRNGLLLAAGIMAAASILAVMVSSGAFDNVTGMISLKQPTGMEKYIPSVPAFTLSGKVIINFFLGVALLLTFIILDRTVLRPFFQRRSGTMV